MTLATSPKLEQIAKFLATRLRGNPVVQEAWVHVESGVFHVTVIVDTDSREEERAVRSTHLSLLDAFPELLIDMWVTTRPQSSSEDRRGLVHPRAQRIEL